jgi:hypothetical protein
MENIITFHSCYSLQKMVYWILKLDSLIQLEFTQKITALQMLLSYVLRIVKAMNYIHYEKWYNVLNDLIIL